jgi:hypothetical protein
MGTIKFRMGAMKMQSLITTEESYKTVYLPASHKVIYDLIGIGKENAMPVKKLMELTGFSEKGVRGRVKYMVYIHELPISTDRKGYYICRTPEERMASHNNLKRHARSELKRAYKIKNAPDINQITVVLEEEPKEVIGDEAHFETGDVR